jgi:hypothetical protein
MIQAIKEITPDLVPKGKKTGWRYQDELRNRLWIDSLPRGVNFTYSAYKDMPVTVAKPSTWLRIEDQNGWGSCQGHSLTTAMEIAYWLATGGQVVQLSRWMGYVGTQLIDGIRGDRGSTIAGGAELARTRGVCPEELYPYPRNGYTQQITAEQYAAGAPYKLKTFRRMTTIGDCRKWLDAGVGAISIGVRWGRGGGHAICLCETDGSDFVYANSWGTGWGDRGYGRWSERELSSLLRDNYTVAIGMTDMATPKPRETDWSLFPENR